MRRTRSETLAYVVDYLKGKKKPLKMSEDKARAVFDEYFNGNDIFTAYEYPHNYVLIYSDVVFNEVIYNVMLVDKLDTDTIIAELDFDTERDLRKYVVEYLHLEF